MNIATTSKIEQIRKHFQSLSKPEMRAYLSKLTKEESKLFYLNPRLFLFDKQIIPPGDWRYCLLRCGRRFGKSMSGSAWIAEKVIAGCHSLGLCGEDYSSVRDIMVKNVINWFPKDEAKYLGGDQHKIVFKSYPCQIYCYTSDKEVKGPSLEYLWCDEVGNWCDRLPDKIRIRFDSLDTAVSVGKHPQTIITTTPRAFPFFFDFQDKVDSHDPDYITLTGTMFDNPFLNEGYRQKEIDKYKNDEMRLRQEIYGDLVYQHPHAMFQAAWIADHRITDPNNPGRDQAKDLLYFFTKVKKQEINVKRIVISVDPSGSSKVTSDEVGIVVVAEDFSGELYVLHDKSARMSPDAYSKVARDLFYHYKHHFPNTIIKAETNFGGDQVLTSLRSADSNLIIDRDIKGEGAYKGKSARAEVSAAKYQRGKVHHVGYFEALERQMTNYTGTKQEKSPDRMDALVHAINECVVVPQLGYRDVRVLDAY